MSCSRAASSAATRSLSSAICGQDRRITCQPGELEVEVACAVCVEGVWVVVCRPPVGLDDEPGVRPREVHPVLAWCRFTIGLGSAASRTRCRKRRSSSLRVEDRSSRRPRSRRSSALTPRRPPARASASLHARPAQQAQRERLLHRARERFGGLRRRQVDERALDARAGNAEPCDHLGAGQRAGGVDDDPGTAPRGGARHGHVDRSGHRVEHPQVLGRRPVAQRGRFPGRKDGRQPAPARVDSRGAHRIDAAMELVKAVVLEPMADRLRRHARREQLPPRDHSMLASRDVRDPGVGARTRTRTRGGGCLSFLLYSPHNLRHPSSLTARGAPVGYECYFFARR